MAVACWPTSALTISLQGLPFAIAGVGDLLALFRCVSCRYRFAADASRPALMGAIGRVFSSCEVRPHMHPRMPFSLHQRCHCLCHHGQCEETALCAFECAVCAVRGVC